MKVISWNVNGIRAVSKKGFVEIVKEMNPDVLCLQETKAQVEQLGEEITNIEGYDSFFASAVRKGYSGTVVYTKKKPLSVQVGIAIDEFDDEGRTLTLEYDDFYVINTYVPNSQAKLVRLDFRKKYNDSLWQFAKELSVNKEVILCGDLNVAHNEIDIKNPKSNMNNPGFFIDERIKFGEFLGMGFVDTFRALHPDEIKYSWWSYRFSARDKNIGWRLDYVVVSKGLIDKVKTAFIDNDVFGSDHCPVGIEFDLK